MMYAARLITPSSFLRDTETARRAGQPGGERGGGELRRIVRVWATSYNNGYSSSTFDKILALAPLHRSSQSYLHPLAQDLSLSLSLVSYTKMRAARYYGKEDIRIVEDLEPPVCGKGQVKIEPAFVGICGTGMSVLALTE